MNIEQWLWPAWAELMALTSADAKTTWRTTYGRLITRHDTFSRAFCARPETAICNDRPFIVKYNHRHPSFLLSSLSFPQQFYILLSYTLYTVCVLFLILSSFILFLFLITFYFFLLSSLYGHLTFLLLFLLSVSQSFSIFLLLLICFFANFL